FVFSVEGHSVTNELWIILAIVLVVYIIDSLYKGDLVIRKENTFLINILYFYVIIIVVGGFNLISISQYLYAVALFLIPISLYFLVSKLKKHQVILLFKVLIVSCLFYFLFVILFCVIYYINYKL